VTAAGGYPDKGDDAPGPLVFDRHLVLEQLGGWRGMVDTTLPTIAFILANAWGGLRIGIWAAIGAALLVFVLRLIRRESVQQAVSGLFAVGIAVVIATTSGQARDFFAFGILRNAVIGVVLVGSILVRWPLIGVIAEFLAPSHLGSLATSSLPGLRRRLGSTPSASTPSAPPLSAQPPANPQTGRRAPDPEPEQHWRQDPRMVRAYSWLTLLWGVTFLARVLVQGLLYQRNDVELLGTASIVLGLPVTAVALVATLWVVARLHRQRYPGPAGGPQAGDENPGETPPGEEQPPGERPAA
jgi:Protein of unknown function (DUF3159)